MLHLILSQVSEACLPLISIFLSLPNHKLRFSDISADSLFAASSYFCILNTLSHGGINAFNSNNNLGTHILLFQHKLLWTTAHFTK